MFYVRESIFKLLLILTWIVSTIYIVVIITGNQNKINKVIDLLFESEIEWVEDLELE
jgi:hypothetical protein